jgi:hypothetical protein
MPKVVIEALNCSWLDNDELEELRQAIQEVDPDAEVKASNMVEKSFDPETQDIIRLWIDAARVAKPLIQEAVSWVRKRRKETTRVAFYKSDGTVLKYLFVPGDGSEPEDLTEQYKDRSRRHS